MCGERGRDRCEAGVACGELALGPLQPRSAALDPGSRPLKCSSTVVAHTHQNNKHTQGYMKAQTDLQRVPRSKQPESEKDCGHTRAFTSHIHGTTAAGDGDNMCFVPYAYVSVHVHMNALPTPISSRYGSSLF